MESFSLNMFSAIIFFILSYGTCGYTTILHQWNKVANPLVLGNRPIKF